VPTSAALSASQIRARFPDDGYVAFHAVRFANLLEIIRETAPDPTHAVLDVGRSALTTLLAELTGARVDSLGFAEDGDHETGRNYHFDLNDAQHPERRRTDIPTYDLIVMGEVIEHIHTSPRLVLSFIRSLLRDGGRVVLQTPNAASLARRIKLLYGRNPFHLISEDDTNPMHFREYTQAELRMYCEGAGLSVVRALSRSYFDQRYASHRTNPGAKLLARGWVKNLAERSLPPSMRTGLTMVAERSTSSL
jgi:2-polyprenyl-3-methyl-5-hydroxy-6-metoxy-1,4-benzoquinol methylase